MILKDWYLMVRCSTCNVFHMRQFVRFFYYFAWFDTLNSIVCRVQPISYTMLKCSLIDSVLKWLRSSSVYWYGYLDYHAHVVYELAITKITAELCRISKCLAWFGTVEFNRLPCPNDKIYDDEVFADRFRYKLTMFDSRVLVRHSPLIYAQIAYQIAAIKITAEICRISYCIAWFDAVELNRLLSPNDKMYDDEIFAGWFRYPLTMFEMRILIGLSRLLHGHIAY